MGMRTSRSLSVEGTQAAGSARRACAASSRSRVVASRSCASMASAKSPMMPCISRKPLVSAQALSNAMPHHSFDEPAAMRVESLKPPAARRMSDCCSSACRLANCMSEAATTWGTWLTTAMESSCSSGAMATTRALKLVMSSCKRWKCSGGVSASGHRIQLAPSKRSGRAPSMPFFSEPAMGWPGT